MNGRAQLAAGAVAVIGGAVALWSVWRWASPPRSPTPTGELGPRGAADPSTLAPTPPPLVASMSESLLAALPAAGELVGLSTVEAGSVAQSCALALPAAMGQGIDEHLAHALGAGATLDEALMRERVDRFEKGALGRLDDAARRAWDAGTLRDRYRIIIQEGARIGGVQIAGIDAEGARIRRDALTWDAAEGQSYISLGSAARPAPGADAGTVTMTVPVRFNDGRTGTLGFICSPATRDEASWIVRSAFVVVDSGPTPPMLGI